MSADDFKHVVLQPDELLMLCPKVRGFGAEALTDIATSIPERLRERVIVVNTDTLDVLIVRKLTG